MDFRLAPLGDSAFLIQLDLPESLDAWRRAGVVLRLAERLRDGRRFLDVVPAYDSVAVHYDPLAWADGWELPGEQVQAALRAVCAALLDEAGRIGPPVGRSVEIPVCYGGDHGPDLRELAEARGLSLDEVIARHSAPEYLVAFLGFLPGFPYLVGLEPSLASPRRATPRLHVPAGAVAIGGAQTGIYPSDSPGGWWLIGRTPLRLFDARREPPSLLAAGDRVRFVPITAARYDELAARRPP